MPNEPVVALTEAEARELTDRIRANLEVTSELIVEAYVRRAWWALGYGSWDFYVISEFGSGPLRVPREDRPEMVRSLRAQQMSNRAIGTAMDVSERTVRRDLGDAGAANAAPADEVTTVIGVDGVSQRAKKRPPEPQSNTLTIERESSPAPREPQGQTVTVVPEPPPPAPYVTPQLWIAARRIRGDAQSVEELAKLAKSLDSRPDTRALEDIDVAIATLQRARAIWPDVEPRAV
jgi:hypothetical protein